jgi:hypothetical protein
MGSYSQALPSQCLGIAQSRARTWSDFIRLANALSALYPKQSEEKRLLDAMLLAMPK